jgi:two-component system, OmpR family, phosphate regulon sensor histidine kinase PhoR
MDNTKPDESSLTHRLDQFNESFASIIRETRQYSTVIFGLSELLYRELAGPLNDEQKELMKALRERTEMLNHYMNQAIQLSEADFQQRPLEKHALNVLELVQRTAQYARNRNKYQNELPFIDTSDVSPELALVADEVDMTVILVQIIDNAIRYNPHKHPITIKTVYTPEIISIYIVDKGIGIPEDEQTRVFQRHTRVSRPDHRVLSGSGLGLYIAREFVKRNNGTLSLTSNEDTGTIIKITLPNAAKESAE